MAVAVVFGRLNQLFDLLLGQVFARPILGIPLADRNCALFVGLDFQPSSNCASCARIASSTNAMTSLGGRLLASGSASLTA